MVFFIFIDFCVKTLMKSIIYCLPDCALGPFTYVCCESCMSGFSVSIVNLSKSGNILFRSVPNGNGLFSSAYLSLVGNNPMVYELRVMAVTTVEELHVNETYHTQHHVLKSVYGKSQSVVGGKLFSSL